MITLESVGAGAVSVRAFVAFAVVVAASGALACSDDVTGNGAGLPEDPDINFIVMARITAGAWHSCAISGFGSGLPLGSGFCWGRNDDHQLGDAGADGAPSGEPAVLALEPVPISGDLVFLRLQAGGQFTCGIPPLELLAYCWGGGVVGGQTTTPTLVSDQFQFRELSAGDNHVCGMILVSKAVYCWGLGDSGQLGDGNAATSTTPVLVAGLAAEDVSAGVTHTCAVTDLGQGLCWGDATSGKLGDGSTGGIESAPVSVVGNLEFIAISAGHDHSCAVATDGAAYCWGSNEFGQLGSSGAGASSATPVVVDGGHVFRAISVGWHHTCAVTENNSGYCWGANDSGQIGNSQIAVSVQSPDSVEADINFQAIQAGRYHTCATSGDIGFCWGGNDFGQVGNGTQTTTPTPGRVTGSPVRASGRS